MKPYTKPTIEVHKLDNDVSLIMMSEDAPPDPNAPWAVSSRQETENTKKIFSNDFTFSNPFNTNDFK